MTKVFKYEVPIVGDGRVKLPIGAQILSAKIINRKLTFWARVDPQMESEERTFPVFGTGYAISSELKLKFIETVFVDNLVFHVFERV